MNNIFEKGLTLTEMLVVISIVIVFSSMVFANYGKGQESMALERAGQKLGQDLRRAQEMAMAGSFDSSTNAVGIYFNESSSTSYILYYNYNTDPVNFYYQSSTDLSKEVISIEEGVKICNIKNNDVDVPSDDISVSFAPPEPVTRIQNDNYNHEAYIILAPEAENCATTTKTRTIKVNNVGRIEVNNP
jgi:Tfp pilus assembly protein FimT